MPSDKEYLEAEKNLLEHHDCVDFIITHTAPYQLITGMQTREGELPFNDFFDELRDKITCQKWCLGHFHDDIIFTDKDIIVYDRIIKITE